MHGNRNAQTHGGYFAEAGAAAQYLRVIAALVRSDATRRPYFVINSLVIFSIPAQSGDSSSRTTSTFQS